MRCRYCKKEIQRVGVTHPYGTYFYYDTVKNPQGLIWGNGRSRGMIYFGKGSYYCHHEPMTETEEVSALMNEYGVDRLPQKKNPFVEKPRPWDSKWRRQTNYGKGRR